jgi:hypothetical protein
MKIKHAFFVLMMGWVAVPTFSMAQDASEETMVANSTITTTSMSNTATQYEDGNHSFQDSGYYSKQELQEQDIRAKHGLEGFLLFLGLLVLYFWYDDWQCRHKND